MTSGPRVPHTDVFLVVCIVAVVVACCGGATPAIAGSVPPHKPVPVAVGGVQPPLHTSGPIIVDAAGKEVRLACVNWYGAEEEDFVVGGLHLRPLADIAALIPRWGFNCVRLPWSVEMVLTNPAVRENVTTANPSLTGKPALDVYAAVVEAITASGVMVILDNHMSDANWCCSTSDGNGLWYTDRWPESDWHAAWSTVAGRFASNPLVIGADLRNEPRNAVVGGKSLKVAWGGGDNATDWAAAAERGARTVLAADATLLIIVEGISFAGDLRGVANRPIVLPAAASRQLVYEAHCYSNFFHATDQASFDSQADAAWGYVTAKGHSYTAPVWLGEFGTCHSPAASCLDPSGSQPVWQAQWWSMVHSYITTRKLNWGYWAVDGTQSRGTGRTAGAVETYGIADATWAEPAAGGDLLRSLQQIQGLP